MKYDFNERHLFRLDEILDDYEISKGDPDVRGWSVLDKEGETFGIVKELIVDLKAMKVRYLDVIATRDIHSEGERHLLIPIGTARIDDINDVIKVRDFDKNLLLKYPDYTGSAITRNYEHNIRETISQYHETKPLNPSSSSNKDEDFYQDHLYDDTNFYHSRRKTDVTKGDREAAPSAFRRKVSERKEKEI